MANKNPYNKHHEGDNQKGLPKKVQESNRKDAAARGQRDKNTNSQRKQTKR